MYSVKTVWTILIIGKLHHAVKEYPAKDLLLNFDVKNRPITSCKTLPPSEA